MLKKALKHWFGYETFKPGQEEIIENVLNEVDTLGILPTGSGKSLCYQLPTYLKEQPTLIVSPLISLMDDQVMQLKALGETKVCHIHSGMDEQEKYNSIRMLKRSRFIFLSPEFLLQPQNFKLIRDINFGLIVLDEAHCLTEWGYDFRPHYAIIGKITKLFKQATLLALTATAPPHLQDDLNDMLQTRFQLVHTTMNRDNISLVHLNFDDDHAKINWLLPFLEQSGSTIIYVSSKTLGRELVKEIYNYGFLTGLYHGDMSYQERHTVQQQFVGNHIPIIVATSAFGMGVNKSDIRTIIHFHLPTNPSNYLQEIGRAGRDGEASQAISLYQPDDAYLLETLLFSEAITSDDINQYTTGQLLNHDKQEVLDILASYYSLNHLKRIFELTNERKNQGLIKMLGYKNLATCRRRYLLDYFNEEISALPNPCCDNDSNCIDISIKNRKKVKRKMSYSEKLNQLF